MSYVQSKLIFSFTFLNLFAHYILFNTFKSIDFILLEVRHKPNNFMLQQKFFVLSRHSLGAVIGYQVVLPIQEIIKTKNVLIELLAWEIMLMADVLAFICLKTAFKLPSALFLNSHSHSFCANNYQINYFLFYLRVRMHQNNANFSLIILQVVKCNGRISSLLLIF